MLNTILNLVFPADCVACGRRVTDWRDGAVCTDCVDKLEPIESRFCQRCGSLEAGADTPLKMSRSCHPCQAGQTRFDLGRSALVFDEPLRTAIHHFKYNDRVSLARPFGRALLECYEKSPFIATRVIPVPLHRKRERRRGYNQATLLAQRLGLEVHTGLIRRIRPTATQTGLSRGQRVENVRGAFECRAPMTGAYLVIDDVMTTGATVNEIARVMRKNGASRIEVLTLTRVTYQ